jgi:hypothetical protein
MSWVIRSEIKRDNKYRYLDEGLNAYTTLDKAIKFKTKKQATENLLLNEKHEKVIKI